MGTYIGRGFGGMGGGLGVKGHHRGGSEPVDPDPDPLVPPFLNPIPGRSPSRPSPDPVFSLGRSSLKGHHNPDPGP